jgi:hypothetical protein
MADLFRIALILGIVGAFAPVAAAQPAVPPHLPQYDLFVRLDTDKHEAHVRQRITWTNKHTRPANELVVNFYPNYRIPDGDHLLLAKTLELLRLNPSYGIDRNGRHGRILSGKVISCCGKEPAAGRLLAFSFRHDNPTAITFELPEQVGPGQAVTVEIECVICLPNKQGRWGHWNGVHYLTNALPVVAYYDDVGWHAMPFVPWHQPWWNEAGVYRATIEVPALERLACSAPTAAESTLPDGYRQIVTEPFVGRDFALVCSKEFQEFTKPVVVPDGRTITLKCLAFSRHAEYANAILDIGAAAIPVYSKWFAAFPYSQMTYVESYFGWNGNECAGLVMIDERVFGMPQLGRGYVEYLVSHETCHQWWYNMIGTNGYAETFMDEGAAAYFTHKLMDRTLGKNNAFLHWPDGLKWMPNINRDNYRYASVYGAIRRDQMPAAAGDLPGFNHLVGLFSGAYDRGSKIFGMIEDRLGPDEFDEFTRGLFEKYGWGVLTANHLRAELECHTGQDWGEFFERWVYGKGLVDWKVKHVSVSPRHRNMIGGVGDASAVEVTVVQTAEYEEPTTVGISLKDGDGYPVRVPVGPGSVTKPGESPSVEQVGPGKYVVRMELPCKPANVKVDPDTVLLDKVPGDNVWRNPPRISVSPLYSMLNESDLTNDYNRWNIGGGPWIGGALYPDPWYTRSTMVGVRAAAYRTQEFAGGVYAAVRSDYRDLIVGADGLLDHWPLPKAQLGYTIEQRVGGPYDDVEGRNTAFRAAGFARYVLQYGSSLYLPPLHYVEAFASYQDNFLPVARTRTRGSVRPDSTSVNGVHYRLNLLTPYWDPECGVWLDAVYGLGTADLGYQAGTHHFRGELAGVRKLPGWLPPVLNDTRIAGRLAVAGATPDRGLFYALGGGTLFRGFDLAERQGSFLWVANTELRLPLYRNVVWDCLDHTVGARDVWLALFYDAGEVFANGRTVGGVAHAVGAGLRVNIALFSFIERATMRVDVGKTLNASTPVQVWFGVQHPF